MSKQFDSTGLTKPGDEFPEQSVSSFLTADISFPTLNRWHHLGEFLWNHGYRFLRTRDDTVNLERYRTFHTEAELDYLYRQSLWTVNVFEAFSIDKEQPVMLKAISTATHELDIMHWSAEFRHDPRFHGIPLLDELSLSDTIHIGVTPLWTYTWLSPYRCREYDTPTVEIVLELAKQILEFLVLLHKNSIMHGDVHSGNILRDPNTPADEYSFALIDFGLGHRFKPTDPLPHTVTTSISDAPEVLLKRTPYDAYKLDVHQFGEMIQGMLASRQIEFVAESLDDWVFDMTHHDPVERLTALEALEDLIDIRDELKMPDLSPKGTSRVSGKDSSHSTSEMSSQR